MSYARKVSVALVVLGALLANTQAAHAVSSVASVATIEHYVAGNAYVTLSGFVDRENEAPGATGDGVVNNNAADSYRCDRSGANLDLPYIDSAASNADQAMDLLLSAYLSGKSVSIEYGTDCKISIVRLR